MNEKNPNQIGCDICGKRIYLPYTCSYCGRTFCDKHRLPENHICPNIPKGRSGWSPRKSPIPKTRKIPQRSILTEKKSNSTLIILLVIVGVIGVLYISNPASFVSIVSELPERIDILLNETLEQVGSDIEESIEEYKEIVKPENIYGNYSFGLVKHSGGVTINSYGNYIVLINNKNSINPTYDQLIKFLESDKTDEYPYQYIITVVGTRYGTAENYVDLILMKGIVDGTESMIIPRICGDFAQRLHNAAELAGIRCGYVSIDLIEYTDPYGHGIPSNVSHALNVFNTTDKGIVYIDCTGGFGDGSSSHDRIINTLVVGRSYIPESIFPEAGWSSTWGNVGKVVTIYITWDGDWD